VRHALLNDSKGVDFCLMRSASTDHLVGSASDRVRPICRHSFARLVGHSDVGLAPTADLNCVHVSERTRREMGTGGNITVLPAAGESSQDSSRFCSAEKGCRRNCILQPDPIGRVGFLIIGLLIACTRSQHADSSSASSLGARVQELGCAIEICRTIVAFQSSVS
jgi:hypothetical protein